MNTEQFSKADKPKYIAKPGSLTIFSAKPEEDYNFWGKLLSFDGVELVLRLFTRESQTKKIFLIGNVADSDAQLKEFGSAVDTKKPNTIILFLNDKYVKKEDLKENEKEKPYYTGILTDEENKPYDVSLWLKLGPKGEFFSGLIKLKEESSLQETNFENIANSSDEDPPF